MVGFSTISIIAGFTQILLALYSFLGTVSIGQLEAVLQRVLLKLADGGRAF